MTAIPAAGPSCGGRLAWWRRVNTGDTTVAVAQRRRAGHHRPARGLAAGARLGAAMTAVDDVLSALDLQASRFRPDSEISWLHRAGRRPVHAQ